MRNAEARTCQSCKNQFVIELDDFGFYEVMKVPPPTWCPECRMVRRLAWCGYRTLYKRKCDFTGEEVISVYHPSSPHKVYRQDVWWSDKWDPKSFGRDYDFSRSFFEQYRDLFREVPLPALHTEYATLVNSEYCNAAAELKNCYLCFKADYSENSAYTNTMTHLRDCVDVSFTNKSELCYEGLTLNDCYRVFYSEDCDHSHDIYFSKDLMGCSYCIGCVNLRNKSYYLFNQPSTKEEFEKTIRDLDLGSRKSVGSLRKRVGNDFLKYPRKAFHGWKNTDVSGDYIFKSKNVHDSYMMGNAENVRYSQLLKAGPSANSYDHTMFGLRSEWIYECPWVGLDVRMLKFSIWNYGAHDLEYCFGCHGSGNMFGCVGVRNSEYCVFNKQYSKEEYRDLVSRIREQMTKVLYRDSLGREYRYGEWLPGEFSPWPYNETMGDEFARKSKEEAIRAGFLWRDLDRRDYQGATIDVPDHVKDVTDDILKGILKCSECGKNYQVIKMELDFYRRMSIPIPIRCPFCRDRARIRRLNPIAIYDRKCAKCGKEIKTSYVPDWPETVYCESCYNSEVA
ncbi:hypothetical protein C4571_01665 [Candidatus Parcubacteria bacterium]|nr:MAG: hypothetical protein C4571_01665 [Candidatus Parcubacteria bacterium]